MFLTVSCFYGCPSNCLGFFIVSHTLFWTDRRRLKCHDWELWYYLSYQSLLTGFVIARSCRSSRRWRRTTVYSDYVGKIHVKLFNIPRPNDFKRSSVSVLISGIPGMDLSRDGSRWSRVISFLAFKSASIFRFRSNSALRSAMVKCDRVTEIGLEMCNTAGCLLTLTMTGGGAQGSLNKFPVSGIPSWLDDRVPIRVGLSVPIVVQRDKAVSRSPKGIFITQSNTYVQ